MATPAPPLSLSPLSNVIPTPLNDVEQRIITLPDEPWSRQRAFSIARGDFEMAERYRMSSGHDMRFRNSDELFLGWMQQRFWEGTRIPRSSIGVPISMDQVEALMPSIISNIFPLRDNVEVRPQPGSSADEAKAVYDLLMAQLDDMDPESMVSSREEIRKAVKQGLVYGNGVLELTWVYKKVTRKRTIAKFVPVTKQVPDPMSGQLSTVMTGEQRRVVAEVSYSDELNYPELRQRDIRDCYWDPNLASPNFQLGRFFAVRQLVPVGELKLLRSNPMFDIPDDGRLTEMAKGRTGTYSDNLKNSPDLYRNIMSPTSVDYVEIAA